MNNRSIRKGVVLAAGWGSRIQGRFQGPKPLLPVAGRPILYRTLDVLRRGGVDEIAVVVGHQAEKIRRAIAVYNMRESTHIISIFNPHWRFPNGLSLLAAKQFTAHEDFILTMSDHLLDPEIITLMQTASFPADAILAVDEKIDTIQDLDDATKVLINKSGQIQAIGKTLEHYNAIDCGVFRLNKAVYGTLLLANATSKYSLSDSMTILASNGMFYGVSIGKARWQDIDDGYMLDAATSLIGSRPILEVGLV